LKIESELDLDLSCFLLSNFQSFRLHFISWGIFDGFAEQGTTSSIFGQISVGSADLPEHEVETK
jgi:hypothetical protein